VGEHVAARGERQGGNSEDRDDSDSVEIMAGWRSRGRHRGKWLL